MYFRNLKISTLIRTYSTKASRSATENYYGSKWFNDIDPELVMTKEVGKSSSKRSNPQNRSDDYQILPSLHKKTNLFIPPIGLSCLRLPSYDNHSHHIVDTALDRGINLLETSTLFPNSQFVVGEAINNSDRRINREEIIFLSKAGFQVDELPHDVTIFPSCLKDPIFNQ